ncbi:branched-chain amino acid aminotransferase [Streptomyces koyangensis]|uniref:Branched-chain-amino-acid aminotransferase n=1 Tax=Streptomyces koyangensis TaxID=188770 RepID=A0A385D6J7_9ACTN|nr:branched-chain amino acid aminotransferase [Streptomyces koyangensis]AXQ53531.1 branched-chain amino acid aminotransferase [Streptomyces koyangensis]
MTSVAHSRSEPIRDPGHGEAFTGHMISMDWTETDGWTPPQLMPLAPLPVHPGTIGLHYGQVAYEGLKAHRRSDGRMALFRPRDHARRFQRSTHRLAMPTLPEDAFIETAELLVAADQGSLSDDPSHSLYLRPFMIATDVSLMLRPSRGFRFLLMAFVAGSFFDPDVEAVSVWVSHDRVRAFPGGTGDVKIAGNYAPTFPAQRQAIAAGCQQTVWLDAVERKYVEELGGSNAFLVRGRGPRAEVVTPELTGTLLPGVTRDTILTLAERLGHPTRTTRVSLEQWRADCLDDTVTEAFACGTAAVLTPVGKVVDPVGGDWLIGDGRPGPVALKLHRALVELHHGVLEDPEDWCHVL